MKKIILLIIGLTTVFLNAMAQTKASDKYAQDAAYIVIDTWAYAISWASDPNDPSETSVPVIISKPHSSEWIITIASDDDVIINGNFSLVDATTEDNNVEFVGCGVNTVTEEFIAFTLSCDGNEVSISFDNPQKLGLSTIDSPLSLFKASVNNPDTGVYFHDTVSITDFNNLEEGTISQLKKNLLRNPYINKL